MNKTIGDYFDLPRSQAAKALQPEPRAIPTTEQVHLLLSSMPSKTMVQRRDRAIVAASFLFGTRSNATASLRLRHIDVTARRVYQDAAVVRTKNAKSQTTFWFPVGDLIETIVVSWISEMIDFSGRPDDALFPADADLTCSRLSFSSRVPVEPWQTDSGVRRAFRRGSRSAGLPYFNPHSAKHFLRAIRDEVCRTAEHRKAWSYNLGHENEQITESNYAKMTDQRRDEVFVRLHAGEMETEAEKDLLLAFHEHRLVPGTPEFEAAERLDEERRRRWKGASRSS